MMIRLFDDQDRPVGDVYYGPGAGVFFEVGRVYPIDEAIRSKITSAERFKSHKIVEDLGANEFNGRLVPAVKSILIVK